MKITRWKRVWGRIELSGNTGSSFVFSEAIGTERRKIRSLKIVEFKDMLPSFKKKKSIDKCALYPGWFHIDNFFQIHHILCPCLISMSSVSPPLLPVSFHPPISLLISSCRWVWFCVSI